MKREIPPLNALRSFEAAARNGSFRDAAAELNVSQSAISHQVKHLEVALGLELFVRRPRAVELTAAGKSYYPVLKDAFDSIADGTRALLRPQAEDVLTIQMYSTFAVRWLMLRMDRFHQAHPDIQVRLITSQSDADFDQHDIDLAVKIGEADKKDVTYDYLFTPALFPVCSPRLLEGEPRLRTPEDLVNHPILQVYPSERDWYAWLAEVGATGVDPDAGLRFDSYDHALKMAARGLGVAMAMQPYVAEDFSTGLLVDMFPDRHVNAAGHWFLACPKDRDRSRKISMFRNWLLEEVEADPDLLPLRSSEYQS